MGLQKSVLIKQNEAIKELKLRINEVLSKLSFLEKSLFNNISEGDDSKRLNKWLNKQINVKQTNDQLEDIEPIKEPLNEFKDSSIGNNGVKQINKRNHTNLNVVTKEDHILTTLRDIDSIFKILSKQELKTFLTIYQLEDEGKMVNYNTLALTMGLSINCIRTYIHNLLRKNTPIFRNRINNNNAIFSIKKEFKALNLKNKLINIYYERDPNQTTLF